MEELNELNEQKIQNLETTVIELKGERQRSHHTIQSVVPGASSLLGKQMDQRNALFRTCREIYQADPFAGSGMYWIDPDGQGVGDDPIHVECDMIAG